MLVTVSHIWHYSDGDVYPQTSSNWKLLPFPVRIDTGRLDDRQYTTGMIGKLFPQYVNITVDKYNGKVYIIAHGSGILNLTSLREK